MTQLLYLKRSPRVGLWRSLGARFHGMEEVVGSNPTRSTKPLKELQPSICLERRRRSPIGVQNGRQAEVIRESIEK